MSASLLDPDHVLHPYLVSSLVTRYIWYNGLIPLPVASAYTPVPQQSRQPAKIVQLYAPYGIKTISFVVIRRDKQPVVPSPDSLSNNDKLLYSDVIVEAPALDAGGQNHLYAARGVYVYALIQPVYPTDGLNEGRHPYDVTPASTNKLPGTNFNQTLTASTGPVGRTQ